MFRFMCSSQGVKHLHDHNLCHFDIKPANSFISLDGKACKLGDFGLVVSLDDPDVKSVAQEGDPKYMAPELMQGHFGKPADVFRCVLIHTIAYTIAGNWLQFSN